MILNNTDSVQDKIIDQADSISGTIDNLLEIVRELDTRLTKAYEILEAQGIDAI